MVGTESDVVQIARDATGPTTTGGLLRATREAFGFDLRNVAEVLRIRYPYLDAIEEDRFDELPGATYAVGFVRAYAQHLGLDGAEVVLRFRCETEAANEKPKLVFPAPLVEAKVPGGAVLLIAVFLVVLVYSSWIYVSLQGGTLGSIVPELQRRVAVLMGDKSANRPLPPIAAPLQKSVQTTVAEPASSEIASVSTEIADQAPLAAATASVEQAAESIATDADNAELAAGEDDFTSTTDATDAELAAGEGDFTSTTDATDATDTTDTAVSPAVSSGDGGSLAALEAATEAAELPTLPLDQPVDPVREPVVYGVEDADVRIVILATSDSWVEIKDVDDTLLLTRVMRTGDSYRVPDRSGLTLMTGNAGALQFDVDGVTVEKIGPNGAVRRDVKLVPELLKSNTAHNP